MTVQARTDLGKLAGTLAVVSTSTEARFLYMGDRLGESGELLAALARTFESLSGELTGESLRHSTGELARIALRVASLSDARGDEMAALARLGGMIAGIESRVGRMTKSVGGIGTLAMNAKIAVAHIDDTRRELAGFTTDISATLRTAENSLKHFAAELAGVRGILSDALKTQHAIEAAQGAAVRTIPQRLIKSVEAIAERGKRAAAAALVVGQGSQRVVRRIGDAVMALQIGDVTRQRIEHVEYALGLVADLPSGSAVTAHDALTGLIGRLQSAQLSDTADKFDRDVGLILTALRALATDAHEILRLGNDAFSASAAHRVSFLGELAAEVGEVEKLLGGFHGARLEAHKVAASVAEATGRLVARIAMVQSLEADIRIMGLNMSFKCGRLGVAGRPLSVIAQELRLYAKEIAGEASEIMRDLDAIVAIAGALGGDASDSESAEIASIAQGLGDSLSRLTIIGQSLGNSLSALERGGEVVTGFLGEAVARAGTSGEVGVVLRRAAAELAHTGRPPDGEAATAHPEAARLLELIRRSYTMEGERVLFGRYVPGMKPEKPEVVSIPTAPPAPGDGLDDFFF